MSTSKKRLSSSQIAAALEEEGAAGSGYGAPHPEEAEKRRKRNIYDENHPKGEYPKQEKA